MFLWPTQCFLCCTDSVRRTNFNEIAINAKKEDIVRIRIRIIYFENSQFIDTLQMLLSKTCRFSGFSKLKITVIGKLNWGTSWNFERRFTSSHLSSGTRLMSHVTYLQGSCSCSLTTERLVKPFIEAEFWVRFLNFSAHLSFLFQYHCLGCGLEAGLDINTAVIHSLTCSFSCMFDLFSWLVEKLKQRGHFHWMLLKGVELAQGEGLLHVGQPCLVYSAVFQLINLANVRSSPPLPPQWCSEQDISGSDPPPPENWWSTLSMIVYHIQE